MATLGGTPTPPSGMTTGGFYTGTKAHARVYAGPTVQPVSGQSQYASAPAEAEARPFENVGKINISPFEPLGSQPPPGQGPPMPNAETMIHSSFGNIPGANFIGGGIDFLSNIAGHLNGATASPQANEFAAHLFNTPDEQLNEQERQIKALNVGIFANPPDSPMMQGKQIADMYKAYQIAEAHAKGGSAMLTAGFEPQDIANPFALYGLGQSLLKRGLGSLPSVQTPFGQMGDQLQALKEGTPDTLGPERQSIKEQWQAGKLNDNEARDAIAQSAFALSNPNPVKLDDRLGPLDTVVNSALALLGEVATDPLSIPAVAATGGGYLAKEPVEATLTSIARSVGRAATVNEAKTLGIDAAEHVASSAGEATGRAAIDAAMQQVEGVAQGQVGATAFSRNLPKEATALAKQTGRVGAEHISAEDRLRVLMDMGADPNHPLSGAIKEGIQAAGLKGEIATKLPTVVRMSEAVNKMIDPLSMFGYWKTGRVVPMAGAKGVSLGFHDAIGWRVARRLDGAYAAAGVDPEVADSSRYISAANHAVQAGDRANTQRMVSVNSVFRDGGTPTERALTTVSQRSGDIRRLTRDQVDKTMEFIVPATRGGRGEAMVAWRDRAARQLVDMGADPARARATARTMDERMMRALANDHYGYIVNTVDKARRAAQPNAEWSADALKRITYMGPRQMAQQDAAQIAKDVASGDFEAVRTAVRRFKDLNQAVSESLDDATLLKQVKHVLGQIDDALPVRIDNTETLPPELQDFVKDHPGYSLMLRPEDDKLLVPVRDETGAITNMQTWLDNVTERTPKVEVTQAKSIREGLFRTVSGGEIERNAGRRFVANMADSEGLSERESMALLRAIREGGKIAGTGPQGLSAQGIYHAVDMAKLPAERIEIAKRSVIDNLLDAYENEARMVGVLPKLTGWAKQEARALPGLGGNQVGWLSDALYPAVKFMQNPLFFAQEFPESAFFLALQGRYPMSLMVPDIAARGLEKIGLGGIRAAKADINLWNDKTMVVMDRLTRMSVNAEADFYEASELARMGLTNAAIMTDDRTALGQVLGKYRKLGYGGIGLAQRKQRSVYLAARAEYGEQFRRSLMQNSPQSWYAVRSYFPKSFSDGDVAVQWTMDLMARANPDSVYSAIGAGVPNMVQPSHIGARAEISDKLIRHFVYGEADAPNHTWADLVGEIKTGTKSIDQVRNDLKLRGADPDYIERAVHQLTFGSPDEFYAAAVTNGISPETTAIWRATNKAAAENAGISEGEYLSRNFAGRPLEVDQMGNHVGDTLYDDIVESMRARGKDIPEPTSSVVAAQKNAARGMITDTLPAPKVRTWEKARADRLADPTLGAPPMRDVAEAVPFARFGQDARGNATLPASFTAEPDYVHRVVHQNRVNADWREGEYVSSGKPASYIASNDQFVIQRARRDVTEWEQKTGGVNATENLTAKTAVPKGAIEVLHEDGVWRPVAPKPKMGPALWQSPIHTVGPISPEQYRRQIMAMMDPEVMSARGMRAMTEKDVSEAIEWYDHIRRAQFSLVDPGLSESERAAQAARHLVAFGVTQLNTTPSDGFRYVYKAMGMAARGEKLPEEERAILQSSLGLNPEQLQALIFDQSPKIEQLGIAQKLYDFIDSLAGSERRTNGVLGPNGDWGPVAVDVWMKRDFGYLDDKMGDWVHRLIERPGPTPEAGPIRGVSSKFTKGHGFDITMSDGSTEHIPMSQITESVPTDHQYDYGVELANDMRDHFNQTNFMNRKWTSYEMQALGWYRMQMLKSSEGDLGGVTNAMFEQSRWMGSNDLVPSTHAPMQDVHPWDQIVSPEHYKAITTEGAHHASDEAEMLSGAPVLTKMDADAVVNGEYRPAQTVELLTDPSGARQYLAHYLYLSEQDSGMLMRDYTGATRTPNYAKGVGISVDIPVRDEEHAKDLLQTLAADDGAPLQAIGPHTFVARAHDGSLHLRTLWVPGEGVKPNRLGFDKVLADSGLTDALAREGVTGKDTLVDFVHLKNDWKAQPDGKAYMDEIVKGGGGTYGAMRTPEQRAATIAQAEQAYADAKTANVGATALAAAEREVKRARGAPIGRPESEVRQLVGESRVRVRQTVTDEFNRRAAREVRNERERVLGEARDAAGADLGTDPRWSDVLDRATGSNGEPLFERTPNGTVRAAITRSDSQHRRAQLYFSRRNVTDQSLLHELIHKDAWQFDDSANRVIAGQHAGLEGTPYGTWHQGTPLTEAQHEWLVQQYMLWAQHPDTIHPTLQPLLKHLSDSMASQRTLAAGSTKPSREAIKAIDLDIARLQAHRATLKAPYALARVDAQLAERQSTRAAAQASAKALRAQGGLSPEVKEVLDRYARSAGAKSESKASAFNSDEESILGWAQAGMAAAQTRANNLVHVRGERSALERSINHPFLGIYPSSYMWGKVLPYLTEFLMFRPFGLKAPGLALTMGNDMYQSFNRQQQYDPKLRDYLYKNEPFLRALSMFTPGTPWDLPVGAPFWARSLMETWLDNQVRKQRGQKEKNIDVPSTILQAALKGLSPRGPTSYGPVIGAAQHLPELAGTMLTGQPQPGSLSGQPPVPTP